MSVKAKLLFLSCTLSCVVHSILQLESIIFYKTVNECTTQFDMTENGYFALCGD